MNSDLQDFQRLASALQPWNEELVIVGGWAHRLHREHPLADVPLYAPIRTRDADVAFGERAHLAGTIARALEEAGFREELSSDETPPVAQYHLGTGDEGFYAEFLTPLMGSGIKRDGSVDATEARGGITAQKLRHLEVLLVAPWRVSVGGGASAQLPSPIEIHVSNPASFIVQKLLIHAARKPSKRAQDMLYIHDTIELFSGSLQELNGLWRTQIRDSLSASQRDTIEEMPRRMFSSVTNAVREAAMIPVDRGLRAEEVRAVCEQGLTQLLLDE